MTKLYKFVLISIISFFAINVEVKALVPSNYNNHVTCDTLTTTYANEFSTGNVLFDATDYQTNCVYIAEYKPIFESWSTLGKQCLIFQVAYNKDSYKESGLGFIEKDSNDHTKINYSRETSEGTLVNADAATGDTTKILEYYNSFGGVCPREVTYNHGTGATNFHVYYNSPNWFTKSGESMDREYVRTPELEVDPLLMQIGEEKLETCADILGEELVNVIQKIYNLVKIAIPLILFALGSIDMVQAVFSGSEDKMKKAQGKLMKRVIVAVAIFLIPTILGVILDIGNEIWPKVISDNLCGINL